MELQKAIEIANQYQLWRKGLIDVLPAVAEITEALDCLINLASNVESEGE